MDAISDLLADQPGAGWAGPVYFAITPGADAARDAERTTRPLRARNGLTGVPLRPEVLHVSLLGIARRPGLRREAVEAACTAAAAVTMPPFEIAFDRAGSFRRKERFDRQSEWPLVLFGGDGVIGVEMLQRALISELEKAGFGFEKRNYEPHMTLLYDRLRVTEQLIAPVRWRVREFVLIHGLHGHARQIHLARWKLRSSSPVVPT